MRCFGRWVIVLALLSLPACSGNDKGVRKGDRSGKSSLSSRYEAAIAIASRTRQDEALAVVPVDAAKEGDAAMVKKCLRSIASRSAQDDAAFTAAVALANANKGQEAKEVALMIASRSRQDEALVKIAKGD
jgi:DNA-directed RNA polymerase subunit K/omega